jgi:hypothetical protein
MLAAWMPQPSYAPHCCTPGLPSNNWQSYRAYANNIATSVTCGTSRLMLQRPRCVSSSAVCHPQRNRAKIQIAARHQAHNVRVFGSVAIYRPTEQ